MSTVDDRTRGDGEMQRWPLSSTQRWVELGARLGRKVDDGMVMGIVVRVRGPLDVDLLDQAYDDLVARHDLLRTRLVKQDREAWQEVEPHRPAALHRAPGVVADDDEDTVTGEWTSWDIPFGEPPVVHGFVAQRGLDHHLVGLTFDHTAVDPRSLVLGMRDLADLYTARLAGRSLDPLPLQYGAYAAWQQERMAPRLRDDRRAWSAALRGIHPPRYRRDLPFVPERRPVCEELRALLLDEDELQEVQRWSLAHRSTPFCSLLAAFARTCTTQTDARDLPIATVFEKRDHPGSHDLLGPFIHGTLLRVAVDDGEPWAAFVRRLREHVTETYDRAHVNLVEVVLRAPRLVPGTWGVEPSWSRSFQYIPLDVTGSYAFGQATGEVVRTAGPHPSKVDYGLHLWVQPAAGGGLAGRLVYDTTELTRTTAEAFMGRWAATVRDLLGSS